MIQSHSEVPEADEDWPILPAILEFRDRVRARLVRLYDDIASGKRTITRNIARMLVITLEHEGFHVEVGGFGSFLARANITVIHSQTLLYICSFNSLGPAHYRHLASQLLRVSPICTVGSDDTVAHLTYHNSWARHRYPRTR